MRKFIANSIWLGVIFSVLITLPVCALTGTILHAMNTSADIYDFAYDYIFIVFAGIPATILYNLSSSIIRSFGDSKTPLYFLLLSSLLNIVLDLVTIINFGMGVAGAAYATVFSQLVSGVLCSVYMYKHFQIVHCNKNELRPSPSYLKRLTIMGVPMGLQYTITAVGSVILQTAVNGLGYVSIAAITAGNKVRTFFSTPYDSLGGTMATFAGQNVGARKFDRIKSGLFAASKIGFAYMLISLLVMVFFGRQLALLFVSAEDTEIIEFTRFYLVVDASFGMLLSCVNVFRFTMQGMGFSGPAMFAGIMEMIGRSLAAFMLVPIYGFKGACFAGAIAWFFADLFLIPGCFAFINKLKRQAGLI